MVAAAEIALEPHVDEELETADVVSEIVKLAVMKRTMPIGISQS